jgi:tRNA threonylcarbamoyladenosine biosynthesis protein TsaB
MHMTVLGIDTATTRGSVALARQGEVLSSEALHERGAHARDLVQRIDRLLAGTGLGPGDLRGIAVTLGPGSFTGVRVGLSTAKGLAYALDIGLGGLSTLEALARAVLLEGAGTAPAVCAAIEAGRGEVYAAIFRVEQGEPVRETEDRSYRPADLARSLASGTLVVGDGASRVESTARDEGRDIRMIEPWPLLAGPLALWGCRALASGARYLPGQPRPNYVRPSDAEAPRR